MTEKLYEKGHEQNVPGEPVDFKLHSKDNLGLDIRHSKAVFLDVNIEYQVEPMKES